MRQSRIPEEPSVADDHVVVIAQHISEGRKVRMFRPSDSFLAVYDWFGSENLEPEFFSLSFEPTSPPIFPDKSVRLAERRIVYMKESESPIPLSQEENEVSLKGDNTCELDHDSSDIASQNDLPSIAK